MTDSKSAPARSLNTGEKILHKMRDFFQGVFGHAEAARVH